MRKVNILLSVLGGVVAGLVIGILFAPYKGTKTRRKISQKGEELTEGLKSKFHQFGDFIHEKLDGTFGGTRHLIKTGKSKL